MFDRPPCDASDAFLDFPVMGCHANVFTMSASHQIQTGRLRCIYPCRGALQEAKSGDLMHLVKGGRDGISEQRIADAVRKEGTSSDGRCSTNSTLAELPPGKHETSEPA